VRPASYKVISVWRHRRKKKKKILIQVVVDYFRNKILRTITALIGIKGGNPVQENNFCSVLCGYGHATVPKKNLPLKFITGRNNVDLKISARLKTDLSKRWVIKR
jgi:hypothetical protein